jgi:hypothetical protein
MWYSSAMDLDSQEILNAMSEALLNEYEKHMDNEPFPVDLEKTYAHANESLNEYSIRVFFGESNEDTDEENSNIVQMDLNIKKPSSYDIFSVVRSTVLRAAVIEYYDNYIGRVYIDVTFSVGVESRILFLENKHLDYDFFSKVSKLGLDKISKFRQGIVGEIIMSCVSHAGNSGKLSKNHIVKIWVDSITKDNLIILMTIIGKTIIEHRFGVVYTSMRDFIVTFNGKEIDGEFLRNFSTGLPYI